MTWLLERAAGGRAELKQVSGTVEPDSWTVLAVWTLDVLGWELRKTEHEAWYSSATVVTRWSDRLVCSRAWCWNGLSNQGSLDCWGAW